MLLVLFFTSVSKSFFESKAPEFRTQDKVNMAFIQKLDVVTYNSSCALLSILDEGFTGSS